MISRPPPPLLTAFFSAAALLVSALSIPAEPAHAFTSPQSASVTTGECTTEYNKSPASNTCEYRGGGVSVTNNKCNFFLTCTYQTSTGDDRGDFSITGVSKGDASNLHLCGRTLQVGSC